MSVEYLIPGVVVKYIRGHGLYQESDRASNLAGKGKEREFSRVRVDEEVLRKLEDEDADGDGSDDDEAHADEMLDVGPNR